jgi:hypothetical protein
MMTALEALRSIEKGTTFHAKRLFRIATAEGDLTLGLQIG